MPSSSNELYISPTLPVINELSKADYHNAEGITTPVSRKTCRGIVCVINTKDDKRAEMRRGHCQREAKGLDEVFEAGARITDYLFYSLFQF